MTHHQNTHKSIAQEEEEEEGPSIHVDWNLASGNRSQPVIDRLIFRVQPVSCFVAACNSSSPTRYLCHIVPSTASLVLRAIDLRNCPTPVENLQSTALFSVTRLGNTQKVVLSRGRLVIDMTNGVKLSYH